MQIADNTPVIVAASQVVDRLDASWEKLDPVALAAKAVTQVLATTEVPGLAERVTDIMVIRTFADSVPERIKPLLAPFGSSKQFARSVANLAGLADATATYATAGGQSPQQYTALACSAIARSEAEIVVLCGAEAIGTLRAHQRAGETLDWSDDPKGDSIDHGIGLEDQFVPELAAHKLVAPIDIYPLIEHKKRSERRMGRAEYATFMGEVLTPLANTARTNPFAMFESIAPATEIARASASNRVVADPHLKAMVAKDGVNQSAALLLMGYATACELGLGDRAVFLRGYAEAEEQNLLERMDWSTSPALRWTYARALETAGVAIDDIDAFDLYSCFPVAVIEAMEALGLDLGGTRPISLTGGLPFFGGPGNNYSMHGIASAVSAVQDDRYDTVLVGALGGHLSKHAVGILSRHPGASDPKVDSVRYEGAGKSRSLASEFAGTAVIETFTTKQLAEGLWLAVLAINEVGERVVAGALLESGELMDLCATGEPIGKRVRIEASTNTTHTVVGLA